MVQKCRCLASEPSQWRSKLRLNKRSPLDTGTSTQHQGMQMKSKSVRLFITRLRRVLWKEEIYSLRRRYSTTNSMMLKEQWSNRLRSLTRNTSTCTLYTGQTTSSPTKRTKSQCTSFGVRWKLLWKRDTLALLVCPISILNFLQTYWLMLKSHPHATRFTSHLCMLKRTT